MHPISHYLPIFSTILSVFFSIEIFQRYSTKREAMHLFWWGLGVVFYGLGTFVEACVTLFGWSEFLFKSWYVLGALLGGAPLAIGSCYLLVGKRWSKLVVIIFSITVIITSIFVYLSPINYQLVDPTILNGKVLGWQKIRLVSPLLNTLSFILLVGGALYSAFRFVVDSNSRHVGVGNFIIAIGAILPGVGGMASRVGYTEYIYIGEFF